jgi:hypothetical protein
LRPPLALPLIHLAVCLGSDSGEKSTPRPCSFQSPHCALLHQSRASTVSTVYHAPGQDSARCSSSLTSHCLVSRFGPRRTVPSAGFQVAIIESLLPRCGALPHTHCVDASPFSSDMRHGLGGRISLLLIYEMWIAWAHLPFSSSETEQLPDSV